MSTETIDEVKSSEKQRHGCVTAWLIFMIVANSIVALVYLFAGDTFSDMFTEVSPLMVGLLTLASLANVFFALMLLRWKKFGFYGFIFTGVLALVINLSIGIPLGQSLAGLFGIIVLYGILQIKKDGVSAWQLMD